MTSSQFSKDFVSTGRRDWVEVWHLVLLEMTTDGCRLGNLIPSQDNPCTVHLLPPSSHSLCPTPSSPDLCPFIYLSLMTSFPVPCGSHTSSVTPILRHVDHCKFFLFVYALSVHFKDYIYWNFRRERVNIRLPCTTAHQTIPFALISGSCTSTSGLHHKTASSFVPWHPASCP